SSGFCRQGKLRARVLPGTEGFMISTPTADLVGPGAEFGVRVGEGGESQVHLFQGRLDLVRRTHDRPAERHRLAQGRGVRVPSAGALVAVVSDSNVFVGVAEFERRSSDEVRRRHRAWADAREKLKADPRVALYYSFENQKGWERTVRNQAADGVGD